MKVLKVYNVPLSDRMLYCTKFTLCSVRFSKDFRLGSVKIQANLAQSLTITMHRIRQATEKISKLETKLEEGTNKQYLY